MGLESKFDLENKRLYIEEQVWRDVVVGDSQSAFGNIIGAAEDLIKRDGTFIIHAERGVLSHIHRPSELKELIEEVNTERRQKGLSPFELAKQ